MSAGYPDYTLQLNGTVQPDNGGTGNVALTSNAVLIGQGNQPTTDSGAALASSVLCADASFPPLIRFRINPQASLFISYPAVGDRGLEINCDLTGQRSVAWFRDNPQTHLSIIGQSNGAGGIVSTDALGDLVAQAVNGRVVLAQGASGPQIVLDSGGVKLPTPESIGGQTTAGDGVAAIVVAAFNSALTGALSYTLATYSPSPGALLRVTMYATQSNTSGAGTFGFSVNWNDSVATHTAAPGGSVASGAVGNFVQASLTVRVATGQTLTVSLASSLTAPNFQANVIVERL